jgi:hypothetical protein
MPQRRRWLRLLLPVVVLAVPAAARALPPETRPAVESFVAHATGARVTDLIIEQTVTLYHRENGLRNVTVQERYVYKVPRRLRVEKIVEGQREIYVSVAGRAWVHSRGKTYEAPPSLVGQDRTELLVPRRWTTDDLLREWRLLGIRDDRGHMTRVRGRTVAVIGARTGDRTSPHVWLDPEYGVIRFVTREKQGDGQALVDRTFSEHRRLVDGFYFPYRQEVFEDEKLVRLVTVKSIAVNTNPPDHLFDPASLRAAR